MKVLIFIILNSVFVNSQDLCSQNQTIDIFAHKCSKDRDCVFIGLGDKCCKANGLNYCLKSGMTKTPDCVLYEGNFTGNVLKIYNEEIKNNLYFDETYGFMSVRLNAFCKLKLCYDSKTCYNHIHSDYFKEKKPLPNYVSCDCKRNRVVYERELYPSISNRIKLNRPGEATVIFDLNSAKVPDEYYIKIGNLSINIKHNKEPKLGEFPFKGFRFNHSLAKTINTRSSKILWVSFKRFYIKIGVDSVLENNLVAVFDSLNLDTSNYLFGVDEITLDEAIRIKHKPKLGLKSFDKDPIPLVMNIHNKNLHSTDLKTYSNLIHFSPEIQQLYFKLTSLTIDFTPEEIDSITFSLNNKNCIINRYAKKSFLFNFVYDSISILKRDELDDSDFYIIKIWPKGNHKVSFDDSFGFIKVISGELTLEADNKKQFEINPGEVAWYNNDYFRRVTLINTSRNIPTITIETTKTIPKVDFLFENLINIIKKEYSGKQCKRRNDCLCFFDGHLNGSIIKQIRNICENTQLGNSNLYSCDKSSQKLTSSVLQNNTKSKKIEKAVVNLKSVSLKNQVVKGSIYFEQISNDLISLKGNVSGLKPNSLHAMHIHEYGKTGNDCRETGPHFNPYLNDLHGDVNDHEHQKHAGDLGNIVTDENGNGFINIVEKSFNIKADNYFNVMYRSLVIHISRDDLGRANDSMSRSNGNSGRRIACGIILPID